jgi:CubicO group peptidase (beta-lactamase class C family)
MRRSLWLGAAVLALAAAVAFLRFRPDVAAQVGTGFAAHVVCSLAFESGLDPERVFRSYVAHELGPGSALVSVDVDRVRGLVDASALGVVRARAIHREDLGCTLLAGVDEATLRAESAPPRSGESASAPAWPRAAAPPGVTAAVERAFDEPHAAAGGPLRQTRAVVVVHDGRLVAERYAPDVDARTPLLSWSMAKSVTATLVALAVDEGRLSLDAPAPVPEWRGADDPRGAITLDELLRMSSGLAFDETYGAVNDVSRMLFTRPDTGAFAAAFPLAHVPDSVWSYSSGTSNVVARLLRGLFDGELARMVRWSRERLFEPVGMRSAVFEPDASGTFIGSSFFFATARDWARFGELHRRDGVWQGRRILPEGWVRYVTTPTPAAPRGIYGAHWWLNAGDPDEPTRRMWPSLPRDLYAARGHSGQYVVVAPSARVVVVRLGLSQVDDDAFDGVEPLLRDVLDALAGPSAR